MSLDKQIKGVATTRVDRLVQEASRALAKVVGDAPVGVRDIARLVSEHKTKTTHDACVKAFSDAISADMLANMEGVDDDG